MSVYASKKQLAPKTPKLHQLTGSDSFQSDISRVDTPGITVNSIIHLTAHSECVVVMWCEACQLKPADVAGTDKNLKFKGEGQVTQKYGSNLHVPPGWQSFMPTHVVFIPSCTIRIVG